MENSKKGIKITVKLASIFVFSTVILFVVGYLGYSGMNELNNTSMYLGKNRTKVVDLTLQVDRDLQQALVAERSLMFAEQGSPYFNQLFADHEDNIVQVEERWTEVKSLLSQAELVELANSFDKAFSDWKATTDNIVSLIKTGDEDAIADAQVLSMGQGAKSFDYAREFINTLTERIEKNIDEEIALADSEHSSSTNLIIMSLLFGTIITIIAGIYFSRVIAIPIKKLDGAASKVAAGDTDVSLKVTSNDEIGRLTNSFNVMVQNIKNSMSEANHKSEIANKAAEDANVAREEIQAYQEYLSRNTKILTAEMGKFAHGDLTVQVTPEKPDDEIGKLFLSFNEAVLNIHNMMAKVMEVVSATANSSSQISSSSEEMAAGAQEQSAQTTEVASAVEQMTTTILETTKNAGVASGEAKTAGDLAAEGGHVVENTVKGMNRISEVVAKAAATVKDLGKSSDKIGAIVQVIDDIADQTNLLALNAAIEAARAGEQGRGFAVVADEVRKLAERTTKATKEIASMITTIQKETGGAVQSMDEGTEEVEKGTELANQAGEALKKIIESSNRVVDVVNQVATASEEQSSAAEQISKNIEAISTVTQQSAAGTQQIARASEDLFKLTDNLQSLISQFRINLTAQKKKQETKHKEQNFDTEFKISGNGRLIHS